MALKNLAHDTHFKATFTVSYVALNGAQGEEFTVMYVALKKGVCDEWCRS